MLHWEECSNKYVNGKEENCPQRGDYWEGWTENYQREGGRNIGTAVQGRGPKTKNIGLKKARRKLHERAEQGERLGYKERQERYRHENKKADRSFEIKKNRQYRRTVHTHELLKGDAVVTWTRYKVGITPRDRQCWEQWSLIEGMGRRSTDTHKHESKQGGGELEGRDTGWQKRERAKEKGEKGGILS